jgi:hypothetical protein
VIFFIIKCEFDTAEYGAFFSSFATKKRFKSKVTNRNIDDVSKLMHAIERWWDIIISAELQHCFDPFYLT